MCSKKHVETACGNSAFWTDQIEDGKNEWKDESWYDVNSFGPRRKLGHEAAGPEAVDESLLVEFHKPFDWKELFGGYWAYNSYDGVPARIGCFSQNIFFIIFQQRREMGWPTYHYAFS